jgi:hypothetical protein
MVSDSLWAELPGSHVVGCAGDHPIQEPRIYVRGDNRTILADAITQPTNKSNPHQRRPLNIATRFQHQGAVGSGSSADRTPAHQCVGALTPFDTPHPQRNSRTSLVIFDLRIWHGFCWNVATQFKLTMPNSACNSPLPNCGRRDGSSPAGQLERWSRRAGPGDPWNGETAATPELAYELVIAAARRAFYDEHAGSRPCAPCSFRSWHPCC